MSLPERWLIQRFANGYELVNGVKMHAENGERFQIPHPVLKKHIAVGHFVEVRIDSPRFSAHEDDPDCQCPNCNEEASKPILRHNHPATLIPPPEGRIPSRGWGEDFWVQIVEREEDFFVGRVDNQLHEARLHEIHQDESIILHEDHILAVHGSHRAAMVAAMDVADLKTLAGWLAKLRQNDDSADSDSTGR